MFRLLLLSFLITFSSAFVFGQGDFMVLKKRSKSIQYFWKDSYIAFQLKDLRWVKGIITNIGKDSFDLKIEIIRYSLMGSDTVHYGGYHYAISEIYAMPKKGVQVDYIQNRFQINKSGGHQHWYWIKSGWIFRVGAIGYAVLNVANGIIKNDFSTTGSKLGIAAGVFLVGVLLHGIYTTTFRLGNKYHLESVGTSNKPK
jgi:hypothetical protein